MSGPFLRSPAFGALGVEHGFGLRSSVPPAGLRRPVQVHGRGVIVLGRSDDALGEADALVSAVPDVPVGVATADCVPLLLTERSGRTVAAVHAGWRGLAAGVISAAVDALAGLGVERGGLVCAVGPHIGPCCYEVDEPVLDALRPGYGTTLSRRVSSGRQGHAWLDLGGLACDALRDAGLSFIEVLPDACTSCHGDRFHSYRRDGDRAGRLLHWIAAAPSGSGPRPVRGGPERPVRRGLDTSSGPT